MIRFIDGDKTLFTEIAKCFSVGLIKSVDSPGANASVYLLTSSTEQFFIKPTTKEAANKEILAYELAKGLGLANYLLPIAAFEAKNETTNSVFVAAPMLKTDFMAIQDFEFEHPGSLTALVNTLVESGDAHKLAVFDYLIKNKDRHRGNVQTNGKSIILIDHDNAFNGRCHWQPAYLRDGNWLPGDKLPLCKNYTNLESWFNGLKFKNDILNKALIEIKEAPGTRIDEKINHLWEKVNARD